LFLRFRDGGAPERISTEAAGVELRAEDVFEFRCGSGGGVGDPIDRDPSLVVDDVEAELISRDDAATVYGVVIDDNGAADLALTAARRSEMLRERLAAARPPARPVSDERLDRVAGEPELPLYPGVAHRGAVAYATASGAPLAVAPDHWTEGCAVLESVRSGTGPTVTVRAYLDPKTGRSLYVEAVPGTEPRAFEVSPQHWTTIVSG